MMVSMVPQGMSLDAYNYLLAFTRAHEGYTPFLYNNWPIKNPNRDVTAGVGIAVPDRDTAASDKIRLLFRMKGTNLPPTPEEIKKEFDRVYDQPRTDGNLHTDFEDKSPMYIPPDQMLKSLDAKMLLCWDQRVVQFRDFAGIQAQAQVALMSWNYGMRLSTRTAIRDAVNDGDYFTAAKECVVGLWDPRKNAAHQRLFGNAGLIMMGKKDLNLLPPISGPFKPPPYPPYQFAVPPLTPLVGFRF
jgi:hypothetical protein